MQSVRCEQPRATCLKNKHVRFKDCIGSGRVTDLCCKRNAGWLERKKIRHDERGRGGFVVKTQRRGVGEETITFQDDFFFFGRLARPRWVSKFGFAGVL